MFFCHQTLNQQDKKKKTRQVFGNENTVWINDNWAAVIFSNESKINNYRKHDINLLPKCVKKNRSTNIFVWEKCFGTDIGLLIQLDGKLNTKV